MIHTFLCRWNRTQSQISAPVYLQKSTPYKFILLSIVYYRPNFFLGIGAKVHSVSHTSHPYVADRERQKIIIESTVVKEKQVRLLSLLMLSLASGN